MVIDPEDIDWGSLTVEDLVPYAMAGVPQALKELQLRVNLTTE